jgi:hypothetical protein
VVVQVTITTHTAHGWSRGGIDRASDHIVSSIGKPLSFTNKSQMIHTLGSSLPELHGVRLNHETNPLVIPLVKQCFSKAMVYLLQDSKWWIQALEITQFPSLARM